ncbi:hypothetical protein IMCC1989_439 [gamma proteobacterium IMCC1989]|nr:hypothetical protein IMCC1989_439 [gamma proteobacterium IMCC1989]
MQEIQIYTLGEEWKQCTYIVHLRNDNESYSMYVGVDFDGNVHQPFKMPMTEESIKNKVVSKCTK